MHAALIQNTGGVVRAGMDYPAPTIRAVVRTKAQAIARLAAEGNPVAAPQWLLDFAKFPPSLVTKWTTGVVLASKQWREAA